MDRSRNYDPANTWMAARSKTIELVAAVSLFIDIYRFGSNRDTTWAFFPIDAFRFNDRVSYLGPGTL